MSIAEMTCETDGWELTLRTTPQTCTYYVGGTWICKIFLREHIAALLVVSIDLIAS
jgi:hypothetical protein